MAQPPAPEAFHWFDELRGWLAVGISAVAALFSYLGWRLARSHDKAHFEMVVPAQADKPFLAFIHIVNTGRDTVHTDQLAMRSPRGALLAVGHRAPPSGHWAFVPPLKALVPWEITVAPGCDTERGVFVTLPSGDPPRSIRISVRMPSKSRVIRYKTRTLTAILPASMRKQTD